MTFVGAFCGLAAVGVPVARMDMPCGRRIVVVFPLYVLSRSMGLFPLVALPEAVLGARRELVDCAVGTDVLL